VNAPFDSQVEAKKHLAAWRVGALFMEAGTGKTRVACELVNAVPDIDLVVWVGPLNTIRVRPGITSVIDEINKWGGLRAPVMYVGIESIQASDRIYLELREKIEKASNPFIVVDESIKIKNADAKRTKRLLDLGKMSRYKLILNGTPVSKNLLDMWAQMEFLDPRILKMGKRDFLNTFCRYTTVIKWGGCHRYAKEIITGYENIDYLYSLIRHYIYECDLKLQVKQRYSVLRYTLGEEERAAYANFKEFYLSMDTLFLKNNKIFLEMTQKMQHAYCCSEDKFRVLEKLFEEIDESRTIIFCKYIDSRKECERRFPRATVLSYQKEAFGLNLQHLCYTVYCDKVWDLALRLQSARRTFRTGQEQDCWYWDLTGDAKLEGVIDACIEKKIDMVEYLKGKTREELKEAL
jgi:hypothetical protein